MSQYTKYDTIARVVQRLPLSERQALAKLLTDGQADGDLTEIVYDLVEELVEPVTAPLLHRVTVSFYAPLALLDAEGQVTQLVDELFDGTPCWPAPDYLTSEPVNFDLLEFEAQSFFLDLPHDA